MKKILICILTLIAVVCAFIGCGKANSGKPSSSSSSISSSDKDGSSSSSSVEDSSSTSSEEKDSSSSEEKDNSSSEQDSSSSSAEQDSSSSSSSGGTEQPVENKPIEIQGTQKNFTLDLYKYDSVTLNPLDYIDANGVEGLTYTLTLSNSSAVNLVQDGNNYTLSPKTVSEQTISIKAIKNEKTLLEVTLNLSVVDTAPSAPVISKTSYSYDRNAGGAFELPVKLNGGECSIIRVDGKEIDTSLWSYNATTKCVEISEKYILSLDKGDFSVKLITTGGNANFNLTIFNSVITKFDSVTKKDAVVGKSASVSFTVKYGVTSVTKLTYGDYELKKDKDYIVESNAITVLSDFFKKTVVADTRTYRLFLSNNDSYIFSINVTNSLFYSDYDVTTIHDTLQSDIGHNSLYQDSTRVSIVDAPANSGLSGKVLKYTPYQQEGNLGVYGIYTLQQATGSATWYKIALTHGKYYRVSFDYVTEGTTAGEDFRFKSWNNGIVASPLETGKAGQKQTFDFTFQWDSAQTGIFLYGRFVNGGSIYIDNFTVVEIGDSIQSSMLSERAKTFNAGATSVKLAGNFTGGATIKSVTRTGSMTVDTVNGTKQAISTNYFELASDGLVIKQGLLDQVYGTCSYEITYSNGEADIITLTSNQVYYCNFDETNSWHSSLAEDPGTIEIVSSVDGMSGKALKLETKNWNTHDPSTWYTRIFCFQKAGQGIVGWNEISIANDKYYTLSFKVKVVMNGAKHANLGYYYTITAGNGGETKLPVDYTDGQVKTVTISFKGSDFIALAIGLDPRDNDLVSMLYIDDVSIKEVDNTERSSLTETSKSFKKGTASVKLAGSFNGVTVTSATRTGGMTVDTINGAQAISASYFEVSADGLTVKKGLLDQVYGTCSYTVTYSNGQSDTFTLTSDQVYYCNFDETNSWHSSLSENTNAFEIVNGVSGFNGNVLKYFAGENGANSNWFTRVFCFQKTGTSYGWNEWTLDENKVYEIYFTVKVEMNGASHSNFGYYYTKGPDGETRLPVDYTDGTVKRVSIVIKGSNLTYFAIGLDPRENDTASYIYIDDFGVREVGDEQVAILTERAKSFTDGASSITLGGVFNGVTVTSATRTGTMSVDTINGTQAISASYFLPGGDGLIISKGLLDQVYGTCTYTVTFSNGTVETFTLTSNKVYYCNFDETNSWHSSLSENPSAFEVVNGVDGFNGNVLKYFAGENGANSNWFTRVFCFQKAGTSYNWNEWALNDSKTYEISFKVKVEMNGATHSNFGYYFTKGPDGETKLPVDYTDGEVKTVTVTLSGSDLTYFAIGLDPRENDVVSYIYIDDFSIKEVV